jgi:hypothetical protein
MCVRCFTETDDPHDPMPPWLVLCYIATIVLVIVGVSIIGGQ